MGNTFWRGRYGRITGGMRVLKLEADRREAALGKGARSMSTSAPHVEHTHKMGWNSTFPARRTSAAKGLARFGGANHRPACCK
jgi:hypothetical protein